MNPEKQSVENPPAAPKFLRRVVLGIFVLGPLLLLAWSMLPSLADRGPNITLRIVGNLRQIEIMKEVWAKDHRVTGSVLVSEQDLAPYAHGQTNSLVRSVIGERYIVQPLGVGPEAQLTRATPQYPVGTIIRLRPDTNRLYRVFLPEEQASGKKR